MAPAHDNPAAHGDLMDSAAGDAALPREIERKYLLMALPPPSRLGAPLEVEQGYIPGERIHERLRRLRAVDGGLSFRRTIKLGRGVQRIEVEEDMDEALFAKMWPLTDGQRVHKRRYTVPWEGYHWELDEFLDRTLFLAEVELTSADESPAPPPWLAPLVVREVTDESTYVNLRLAK